MKNGLSNIYWSYNSGLKGLIKNKVIRIFAEWLQRIKLLKKINKHRNKFDIQNNYLNFKKVSARVDMNVRMKDAFRAIINKVTDTI